MPHANIQIGRKRNTDGVAFASLALWQRWHCMPTLPYKQRNRDAVCGLWATCSPTIRFLFELNWRAICKSGWADARTVRPYMHSNSSFNQSFYALVWTMWTCRDFDFEHWSLNIELWPLGLALLSRWFAGKRHVGTHGSCVRFINHTYRLSIQLK